MNTKETQQVMKFDDVYMSLYEYTGKPAGWNGIGREVNVAAQSASIKTIWRDLPEDMQRENYKQVATYPKSFLDIHFGNTPKPTIDQLHQKLVELENKFNALIAKLDNNITIHINEPDDDLPF
jgi:hypothetical protein